MAAAPISRKQLALRAFGLLVFALVSAEAGVRARLYLNDPHSWDADGLFRYRPRLQVHDSPVFTTNNHGFFGDDIETPKPPGVFRIFLMGSSTLTNPEIPRVVQADLNSAGAGRVFEVNSTGLPRYNSFHNALLYEHYLLPLEPDLLVLYFGMNDNGYNSNPRVVDAPPAGLWDWTDMSRSVLLDMLSYHLIHKRMGVTPDFTEIRSASLFEAHLRRIIESAKARHIAVLLVKEAVGFPTDDSALLRSIRDAQRPMRHFWGDLEPSLRGLAAQQKVMDKLADEYALPLVDPGPEMHRNVTVFRDLCHFTSEGNTRFAHILAGKIREETGKQTHTGGA